MEQKELKKVCHFLLMPRTWQQSYTSTGRVLVIVVVLGIV